MEPSRAPADCPSAELSHVMPGRARLRLHMVGLARTEVGRIADALVGHALVDQVRLNPRTGSLLVEHRGELGDILAFAAEARLFRVVRQVPRAPMKRLETALADADDRVARVTNGAFSLGTVAFAALVSGGLYQLGVGKFLPAGMTLFNYALDVMMREAVRERSAERA